MVYLGGNDHNLWAKVRDAAIALRIDAAYSKERILRDYLDTVYFGAGAYGVEAASERYFGLRAGRLDLGQATLLAGLIEDPSRAQPYRHRHAARERQAVALTSMVGNGFATDAEAHRALVRPLRLDRGRRLPPLRGLSIIPGPPFHWGKPGLGCGALVLGAGALIALHRRRGLLPRLAAIGSRAAGGFAIVAGLLLVLGSFRGA